MTLHAYAPGKVNLSLLVGPPRSDGRHELITVIESVSLADELTMSFGDATANADEVRCPGVRGDNLVAAALARFRAATGWNGPPVVVEIDKRLPVAAGMGGGSADAAAALRLASAAAHGDAHELSPGQWDELAAQLGSDVPSQLQPGLVLGAAGGERVEPLPPLVPHALLVLPAEAGLSTAAVYREADRLSIGRSKDELLDAQQRLARSIEATGTIPAGLLVNDLAPAARSLHPPIDEALQAAHDHGADVALVSGSGPTVVGLFGGADAQERAHRAAVALGAHYPRAGIAVPVAPGFGAVREHRDDASQ